MQLYASFPTEFAMAREYPDDPFVRNAPFEDPTREDLRRDCRGQGALTLEGRKAVALQQWQTLNPEELKYELIFARRDTISFDQLQPTLQFVNLEQRHGS